MEGCCLTANALRLAVDEEFYLVGLAIIAPEVYLLTVEPVPVGKEVEHGLRGPFALIHIIDVLRLAGEVDDAKIAGACREGIRSRLANIVETGPDKLSAHKGAVFHHIPGLLVGAGPRSVHVVVGRTHVGGIGIRQPPLLGGLEDAVGGHTVEAVGLQGRDALGHDERTAGEVLGHIGNPLMMVIEAHDINGLALEEMIVGRRLVATCRDGARGIVAANDVGQMVGQQRIDTDLAVLGQCGGIVTSIENEVGLFERQRVGLGRGPLLQHLVTYRPHKDARMVAVAQDEVGEVALMPLVEEAGIVVLGFAAAPHIKRLVHDNEAHRVAHIEQFGSRRVMTGTDGIDAHLLQLHQLAMKSILV